MTYQHFFDIDQHHVWHPFTQGSIWSSYEPLVIESGRGVELIDVKGHSYLDGISSLWCNVHGHSHPQILKALHEQLDRLCHSTLLGLSHVPVLQLTQALLTYLPSPLSRVFYADSGSTAVEAAIRMALEFWSKSDKAKNPQKTQLASLEGGYHGDTLGAVSVGYLADFHGALLHAIKPAQRLTPPHLFRLQGHDATAALDKSIDFAQSFFRAHGSNLAALVVEPLVQGAAGIWIHPKEYLMRLAELCREHNVLLIVDEVATGFGKTGSWFAFQQAGIVPDLLVLGKGLSGGYLPISAVVTTEEIFSGFVGSVEKQKTFFYGQTFAGNPLAACAAHANLQLLNAELLDIVQRRVAYLKTLLERYIRPLQNVFEVRQQGLMVGIELTATPGSFEPYPASQLIGTKITYAARRRRIIIRPLGNVIVLMPALAMDEDFLEELVVATADSIFEICNPQG